MSVRKNNKFVWLTFTAIAVEPLFQTLTYFNDTEKRGVKNSITRHSEIETTNTNAPIENKES